LTTEACNPSKVEEEANSQPEAKPKRATARTALELRAKVKELSKSGKTVTEISNITGKCKFAIYQHIKNLLADGELSENETTYVKSDPLEEGKWYRIIQRTGEELAFYERQRLVPTARKMYYRLIELGLLTKSESLVSQNYYIVMIFVPMNW
jgi:hypothetical protein